MHKLHRRWQRNGGSGLSLPGAGRSVTFLRSSACVLMSSLCFSFSFVYRISVALAFSEWGEKASATATRASRGRRAL